MAWLQAKSDSKMPASQQASPPRELETTGLCLLSLDGGGVRGLSTLIILESLMARINAKRADTVKPCEVFDLIGGTSTGGIIAIMLGRLEMDVSECVKIYTALLEDVFGRQKNMWAVGLTGNMQARFDQTLLRNAIEKTVKSKVPLDTRFADKPEEERSTRTFVVATRGENKNPVRIRDYAMPDGEINYDEVTIVEAALATSAATTFFPPVQIGAREYHDGALGSNNPVNIVWGEAQSLWCTEDEGQEAMSSKVKCLISIGTGNPGTSPIKSGVVGFLKNSLQEIATQTEITAAGAAENFRAWLNPRKTQRYFRFNVEQGLQSVGLEEHKKQGEIESATIDYLNHQVQKFSVSQCAENMSTKTTRTPLEFGNTTSPEAAKNEAEHRKVLKWLAFLDQSELHDENRRKRAPGTGEEFLDGYYKEWLNSDSRLLWLHGDVGCGKTQLCSLLIDRTRQILSEHPVSREPNNGIAYFYFSFDDENTYSSTKFLRTVLSQLCPAYKTLPEVVEMFTSHQPFPAPQKELSKVLESIVRNRVSQVTGTEREAFVVFTSLTLFVDGLDEIPVGAQTEVLNLLMAVASVKSINTRIVVTSRPALKFQQYLKPVNNWRCHEIPSEQVEKDILLFANQQINSHEGLRRVSKDIKVKIRKKLSNGAQGMFRLASLQMQELTVFQGNSIPPSDIDAILNDLPDGLDIYHERILNRIPSRMQQKLRTVLKWLLFSTRPIFVEEAADACIIYPNKQVSFDKNDRLDAIEIVAELTGLVKLKPSWQNDTDSIPLKTHILSLSHFSVYQFLLPPENTTQLSTRTLATNWCFEPKLAHEDIMACCFAYIHHCSVQEDGRIEAYSLRSYAWWNWATHLIAAQSGGQTADARTRLKALRLFNFIVFPALYVDAANRSALYKAFQWLWSWMVSVTLLIGHQTVGRINLLKSILPLGTKFTTIASVAGYAKIIESAKGRSGAQWSQFREGAQFLPKDKYEILLRALKNTHLPNDQLTQDVNSNLNHPISRGKVARLNLVTEDIYEDGTEVENTSQFSGPIPYSFQPLYKDPRTIRLVILFPSENWDSPVDCSIAIDALENNPRYEALSYTWDYSGDLESISIDGNRFEVSKKLHVALCHLRLKSEVRILWIDAICISMRDLAERSSQVSQMTDIYRGAHGVVVWIGLATELSDKGFSHLHTAEKSPLEPSIFALLNDILGRPLWHRSWLIQELVVAKQLSVQCGGLSIRWEDIRDVQKLHDDMKIKLQNELHLEEYTQQDPWDESEQYSTQAAHEEPPAPLPIMAHRRRIRSAIDLVDHWTGFAVLQYLRSHFRRKANISLPELLYISRNHLATDPRDKVFAILSLLPGPDRTDDLLRPDYSLSLSDVFTRVAVHILKKYGNLDLLSCIGQFAGEEHYSRYDIPSWVPMWDGGLGVPLAPGIFMPMQPESFSAGGSSCPEPLTFSDNLREAICQGFIIDSLGGFEDKSGFCGDHRMRVSEYSWSHAFGNSSQAVVALVGRFLDDSERRDACWRTVLADETTLDDGTKARLDPFPVSLVSYDLFSNELRRQQRLFSAPEYYFITKRGFIGKILTSKLCEGDLIAVLLGGKVPFILRSTGQGTYHLIGECYVHGVMDWEQSMKQRLQEHPEFVQQIRLV